MSKIDDVFVKLCREKFKFLEEEFGFRRRRPEINHGPGYVLYMNATTAVSISYDRRDGYVQVGLMRLVDGKPPAYGDPDNYQSLWTLVRLRAPGTPDAAARYEVRTEGQIEAALSADAAMVREHAADILHGDFSVFPELRRVWAEALRPPAAGSSRPGPSTPE